MRFAPRKSSLPSVSSTVPSPSLSSASLASVNVAVLTRTQLAPPLSLRKTPWLGKAA